MFQFLIQNTTPEASAVAPGSSTSSVTYAIGALVIVTLISLVLRKVWRLFNQPELHDLDRKKIAETWAEIEKTAGQGIMGAKIAVMEADKLLDGALKSMFMPGNTLGERLKSAAYKYPNIRKVWNAHRLRNQLVHDASFEISMGQAKSALRDYEAALKTLNVL